MTTGRYAVRFSPTAEQDLDRLTSFLLDRAGNLVELDQVDASIQALRHVVEN